MGKPFIFLSYSHADHRWMQLLEKHLKVLSRDQKISTWSDEAIAGGDKWRQELEGAITQATVAILVVSVDFLASDFVRMVELPRLLKEHDDRGLRVFPVIAKTCGWRAVPRIEDFQVRSRGGQALAQMSHDKRDAALAEIAKEVVGMLQVLPDGPPQATPFPRSLATAEDTAEPTKPTQQQQTDVVPAPLPTPPEARVSGAWSKAWTWLVAGLLAAVLLVWGWVSFTARDRGAAPVEPAPIEKLTEAPAQPAPASGAITREPKQHDRQRAPAEPPSPTASSRADQTATVPEVGQSPASAAEFERLLRENEALKGEAERLRADNREIQAEMERLRSLPRAAWNGSGNPGPSGPPVFGLEPSSPPTPLTPEEALLAAREAVTKVEVTAGGMGSVSEKGAYQAWLGLNALGPEQVIPALLSLSRGQDGTWQEQYAVVKLLGHAAATSQGRALVDEILAEMARRGLEGTAAGSAARHLISVAPAPAESKWKAVFPVLQQASIEEATRFLASLPDFTPVKERDKTAKLVADILAYASDSTALNAAVTALERLNARSEIPRSRQMLTDAPVAKANSLAGLFSHFNDREAIPFLWQAVRTWRHGATSIRPLIWSLYQLDNPACFSVFAELLADTHPANQREILSMAVGKTSDPAFVAAVERLAATTPDPEVRKLAEQYLAKHGVSTAATPAKP